MIREGHWAVAVCQGVPRPAGQQLEVEREELHQEEVGDRRQLAGPTGPWSDVEQGEAGAPVIKLDVEGERRAKHTPDGEAGQGSCSPHLRRGVNHNPAPLPAALLI